MNYARGSLTRMAVRPNAFCKPALRRNHLRLPAARSTTSSLVPEGAEALRSPRIAASRKRKPMRAPRYLPPSCRRVRRNLHRDAER